MGLLDPTPPPYDPLVWEKLPFPERSRAVCQAWAIQGYGSPPGVYAAYAIKIALYVAGWFAFCAATTGLREQATWWLAPIAFQKAIIWSLLFEVLGLGCGSGPLTGRYFPPLGGALYFLRPGTTKLPLFPGAPLIGRDTRGPLEAVLFVALFAACLRALLSSAIGTPELLPIVVLVPLLGVLDKTVFLAARAEHYWVTATIMAITPQWLSGAMCIQLALWFWAGVSKLNHHFPTVVCVMTSNGPFTRFGWLRRAMYQRYPDDLRPSRLATVLGHLGTGLELGVPLAFLLTPLGTAPLVAIILMLLLHGFITSNVPMGVPLEWNVLVVYAGFALFWAHPGISPLALSPPVAAVVAVFAIALPLLGNLFPRYVSFLLAMRYYAGNWASSVWLFEGNAHEKLERLTKSSAWVYTQLARFYDRSTSVGLFGKVIAFRLMHLHGRALPQLLQKLVGDRLDDYTWIDGEVIAGLALGWNFGEGHLHQEQLLASLQRQCGFEEGEVRCIFLESQPLFRNSMEYRLYDAKTGELGRGTLRIDQLRALQPWELPATR